MKHIVITDFDNMRTNPTGYADNYVMWEDGQAILFGECRADPNPFRPSDQKPWEKAYAKLATAENIPWECVMHDRFGKCLLLANAGRLATVNPNTNHGGAYYATQVFWHAGGRGSSSPEWPGSAGCITSHPLDFAKMMSAFRVGEKGTLTIKKDKG